MTWKLDSDKNPNRDYVWGSRALFLWFHQEMKAIAKRWPTSVDEDGETITLLRACARDEVRKNVREALTMGFGGPYLIPV